MIGIYKITSPSGNVYIGQSWEIEKRIARYRTSAHKKQVKIYNSLQKYGVDKHLFEVVHQLPEDIPQEVLDKYEILYWQLYKDCGIEMLNIREPGRGGRNSEETRAKMKANNWNAKHKGENSPHYGKKQSPEVVERAHRNLKGENHPRFGKKNMPDSFYGFKRTEKWKKSIVRKVINVETGEVYPSLRKASEVFSVDETTLCKILRGKYPNKKRLSFLRYLK